MATKTKKYITYIGIIANIVIITACSTNHKKIDWFVADNNHGATYQLAKTVNINIDSKDSVIPDSIDVQINGSVIARSKKTKNINIPTSAIKTVGVKDINIKIYKDKQVYEIPYQITIVSNKEPEKFTYKIVNTYPHDISAFCQGLECNYLQNNNTLFESTGLYGQSELKIVDIKTGKTLKRTQLDKTFFGEGLTVFNNKIILLTWRENTGFIYNPQTLEQVSSFNYQQSKEGWGLTNDGKNIYKSDGSENIWLLDPTNNLKEISHFQVYDNKGPIKKLNELEFIDGYIYANVFQTDKVVIINPLNGVVEGIIDLSGLLKKSDITPETDVLNGIAYDRNHKRLFVTGKKWPKLFEITIHKNDHTH